MSREYNQIEIENLARVRSQNAQGSGHYTPTPPLGASNGILYLKAGAVVACATPLSIRSSRG